MRDGMHGLADSPAKPGPGIEQEAAEDGLNTPPIQIGSLPEDLLAQVFALLRQDDRWVGPASKSCRCAALLACALAPTVTVPLRANGAGLPPLWCATAGRAWAASRP